MSVTVHRAAVVFSPRFAVLVNPPDPATAARLRSGGGGARALEWVVDGMTTDDPTAGRQTLAGLVESFRQAGLSEATAEDLARQAAERGEIDAGAANPIVLPDQVREKAQEEALSLASAVGGGRTRVSDMVAGTTPPLRTLYEGAYHDAMRAAHLESVDLLANFPVATVGFGYTRGDMNPGAARLVPFRNRGHIRAYASLSRTEALLLRLDPLAVHAHLTATGHPLPPGCRCTSGEARDPRAPRHPLANAGAISAARRQCAVAAPLLCPPNHPPARGLRWHRARRAGGVPAAHHLSFVAKQPRVATSSSAASRRSSRPPSTASSTTSWPASHDVPSIPPVAAAAAPAWPACTSASRPVAGSTASSTVPSSSASTASSGGQADRARRRTRRRRAVCGPRPLDRRARPRRNSSPFPEPIGDVPPASVSIPTSSTSCAATSTVTSSRIETALELGAAWVLGRGSVASDEPWDLVASLPGNTPLPPRPDPHNRRDAGPARDTVDDVTASRRSLHRSARHLVPGG